MVKHIHIFGASGSGCTSLGTKLAETLKYSYFDIDNYIYSGGMKKRNRLLRNSLLDKDLRLTPSWVLSGALCGWGNFAINFFDLVIFLYIPQKIRMERLKIREKTNWEKLGKSIENNKIYENFIKWAEGYETRGIDSISLAFHEKWLTELSCPVLRLEGVNTLEENLEIILKKHF
jgi:adenylate kinase family enzyme